MGAITKLMELVGDQSVGQSEKLTEVCRTIDTAVPHANRISLWRFSNDNNELECLKVLDPANGPALCPNLYQDDFPVYFDYIVNNKVVVATDARSHYLTKDFNDCYLKPLNVYSLIDFIVRENDKAIGIICCERVGDMARWDRIDKVAVKRIANILPALYQSS